MARVVSPNDSEELKQTSEHRLFDLFNLPEELSLRFVRLMYTGHRAEILSARGFDGKSYIIKRLKPGARTVADVLELRREFDLSKQIASAGIGPKVEWAAVEKTPVIVMPDHHAVTLYEYFQDPNLTLHDRLKLVAQWCRVLANLHINGIVHRNLNPRHVLVSKAEDPILLIDFSTAVTLQSGKMEISSSNLAGFALDYVAPELKENHSSTYDERADLYSLGVSLLELFAKSLNLRSSGQSDFVNSSHAISQSSLLNWINPETPPCLSRIIYKLLEPNHEKRYRGAIGVAHDLEAIADLLNQADKVSLVQFDVARHDPPLRATVPRRLYGRDIQIHQIQEEWRFVKNRRSSVVLVRGSEGTGKTELMRNFVNQELDRFSNLAVGKYEAIGRDAPYEGIIQAAVALIKKVKTFDDKELEIWRRKLVSSAGDNLVVLIDLIPDLVDLVDVNPTRDSARYGSGARYLQHALTDFFSSFSANGRPLVLFLDDVQWADSGSWDFIQHVAKNHLDSLMLVLACREEHLKSNGLIKEQINILKELSQRLAELKLLEINLADVTSMCSDTFAWKKDKAKMLAERIYHVTKGVPLFVKHILLTICREKYVKFSIKSESFEIEEQRIQEFFEANTGEQLISNRLHDLPENVQLVLSCAAYCGQSFDAKTVASALGGVIEQVENAIRFAINEDLVFSVRPDGFLTSQVNSDNGLHRFQFVHDKIVDSCQKILDPEAAIKQRLGIARVLVGKHNSIKNLNPAEVLTVFHALSHFNDVDHLINDEAERNRLAYLYAEAGEHAQATSAWDIANELFRQGRKYFPKNKIAQERNLFRRLMHGEGVCAMHLGNVKASRAIFAELLDSAISPLESAEVEYAHCRLFTSMQRNDDAIKAGLSGLRALGISERDLRCGKFRSYYKAYQCQRRLSHISVDEICNLPEIKDPEKILALALFTETIHPCLLSDPELGVNLACLQIDYILEHGFSSESSIAFLYLAISINGISVLFGKKIWSNDNLHKILEVYRRMSVGRSISQQSLQSEMVYLAYCGHLLPNYLDAVQGLFPLTTKFIAKGDQVFASYSGLLAISMGLFVGQNVSEMKRLVDAWPEYIFRRNKATFANYVIHKQFLSSLENGSEDLLIDSISGIDESSIDKADSRAFYSTCLLQQGVVNTIIGNHGEAVKKLWKAFLQGQLIKLFAGNFKVIKALFFLAISLSSVYPGASRPYRLLILCQMWWIRRLLSLYASMQKNIGLPKLAFVDALYAEMRGKQEKIIDQKYEIAIQTCLAHKSNIDIAFVSEVFAKSLLRRGLIRNADGVLEMAITAFEKIGFLYKSRQLKSLQADHFGEVHSRRQISQNSESNRHENHEKSVVFDISKAIELANLLSREIRLDDLKEMLLKVLSEASGAGFVALLWRAGTGVGNSDVDALVVIAHSLASGEKFVESRPISIGLASEQAIEYVKKHKDTLFVSNVEQDPDWKRDESLQMRGIKSFLYLPLLVGGVLQGVVCLESDESGQVFTPEKIRLLALLAGQIAISTDNALLYNKLTNALDAEKRARTQEHSAYASYVDAEKARRQLQSSIDAAEAIQKSLVYCKVDTKLYNIDYLYDPAENTGGDWLSTFEDERHGWLYICLGDVTGHGISSALVTAAVAGAVVSSVSRLKKVDIELADAVRNIGLSVNSAVRASGTRNSQLMTLVLIGVDLKTGVASYLNAGHHPVLCGNNSKKLIFERSNPLGLVDLPVFGQKTIALDPGALIAIYSDGLIENRDMNGNRLKVRGLQEIVEKASSPSEVINQLRSYIRSLPRHRVVDDTACIVFQWFGSDVA